jgi:serine/threonine protein kinase
VHHPHTVQFFGASTKQKPFLIVTEFMRGGSLADVFQKGEYPGLRRAVALAAGTAKGMRYLHNRNPQQVIHRDLKPANLMIGASARRPPLCLFLACTAAAARARCVTTACDCLERASKTALPPSHLPDGALAPLNLSHPRSLEPIPTLQNPKNNPPKL